MKLLDIGKLSGNSDIHQELGRLSKLKNSWFCLSMCVCVLCRTKTLFCKRHWCHSRRLCLYPIMGGNESGQSHVDIVPGSTADRLTALGPWVETEIIIVNWLIAQFMQDWWLLNLSYDQCLTWWDRASLSVQNTTKIKNHANLLFNQKTVWLISSVEHKMWFFVEYPCHFLLYKWTKN